MSHLFHETLRLIVLAQADGAADGAAEGGGEGANPPGGGGLFDTWFFLPLMIILVMFYLMVVMPQRRKQREAQDLLGGLKENERVVTIGGIIGSIVSFSKDGKEVILRIDEKTNAKMRVLRTAIARPLKSEDEAETESQSKELGKSV